MIELVDLDVVEHSVEVEMPPRTAEFPVGRDLEPDLLLLLDDLLNLAIFNFLELRRGNLTFLALGAGVLHRRGTHMAREVIGAKWRFSPLCHHFLRDWPAKAAGLNCFEPYHGPRPARLRRRCLTSVGV